MPGFAIDPTLVTLLKFLDGHLSLPSTASSPPALALVPFLVAQLSTLSSRMINEAGTERAHDAADAATFQGVVLVLHCLCSIGLALDRERDEDEPQVGLEDSEKAKREMVECVETVVGTSTFGRFPSSLLISPSPAGLLRFSQTLLPPPGPRPTSADPSSASTDAPSDGPRITELDETPSAPTPPTVTPATPAVAQLQRTCAEFLAIVSFVPPHTTKTTGSPKAAQDRVRECGGLGVLLSMCQIDERNMSASSFFYMVGRLLIIGRPRSNAGTRSLRDSESAQGEPGESGLCVRPPFRHFSSLDPTDAVPRPVARVSSLSTCSDKVGSSSICRQLFGKSRRLYAMLLSFPRIFGLWMR